MKKTFQLRPEGKNPDRVLDAIKHEIRKYIKRERRRELPEGVDYWDFDCKFGLAQDTAEVVHLSALTDLIDDVAKEAGLIGRKRVLDSTALYDAVATQDTVTLIRSAI